MLLKKIKKWFKNLLWQLGSESGATNFPTSLDSYSTKSSGDTISEAHINDPQDAIEALEAKVGVNSSSVVTSFDYKLRHLPAQEQNWDIGTYKITAQQLESDIATGTAPLIVASTTKVTNLNADKLDGKDDTDFGFTDRGDPAAADFIQTDLTTDATWRDLDLSSIVGALEVTVLLRLEILDNAIGQQVLFRTKGNSNAINIDGSHTVVSNVTDYSNPIIKTDSNGVIQYYTSNNVFTTIKITVAGWWVQ